MLRHSSPVERVLTYATFLSFSLALHMIAIMGTRSQAVAPTRDGVAATSSRTAGTSAGSDAGAAGAEATPARAQAARTPRAAQGGRDG